MLVGPVPSMLQELLACEVQFLDALLCQTVHHLCLGGYGCVVGAGNPTSVLALQACTAHQDVLDGVVEHVAHVQHTGHIWRWDNHGIGFTTIGFAAEQFVVQPVLVPFALHFGRAVLGC